MEGDMDIMDVIVIMISSMGYFNLLLLNLSVVVVVVE